jgi:hypothetical protein
VLVMEEKFEALVRGFDENGARFFNELNSTRAQSAI